MTCSEGDWIHLPEQGLRRRYERLCGVGGQGGEGDGHGFLLSVGGQAGERVGKSVQPCKLGDLV